MGKEFYQLFKLNLAAKETLMFNNRLQPSEFITEGKISRIT